MGRGREKRGNLKKFLATLAVGGIVAGIVAAPAVSAATFDGRIEHRCSSTLSQYSRDGWQYAKFFLCAEKVGSTISFTLSVKSLEYYWGWHWYNNKYRAVLKGRVVLQRDGRTVDSAAANDNMWGGKGNSLQGANTITASAPGVYKLVAQADVTGLYWSSDRDSNIVTEPITLELVVN